MKNYRTMVLAITVWIVTGVVIYLLQPEPSADKKELYLRRIGEWSRRLNAIFMENPFSSLISEEQLRKMDELDRELLVPLGPLILPYLILICQDNSWISGAIFKISKFQVHNIVLRRKPRDLLSTTEEFPELVEKNIRYDARKTFLFWWLEGRSRTPHWFAKRYSEWLALRRQPESQRMKIPKLNIADIQYFTDRHGDKTHPYIKLLNIGIAAIPLWLEKLKSEKDMEVQHAIKEALAYLTDGEISVKMTVQQCLGWWQVNKEKWTVPFPKDKNSFLKWLEEEAWEEEKRWGYPHAIVTTISRLEDEKAIEALIRLLRHPHPMVRGRCIEQLQKLFGEQLPKQYSLGVGTDEWERVGNLIEAGKYDLVRKRIRAVQERIKDLNEAKKVADELSEWWVKNKGKLIIYWQRAWENL